MPVSLSVLMPALNEAKNVDAAARGVLRAVDELGIDVELLVLTCLDKHGRHDGTVDIARRLAAEDARVKSVHVDAYQRLGEKFRNGVMLAAKTHVVMIPGDNENDPSSFTQVFRRVGEADMILSYTVNPEIRPWYRRVLSRTYTFALNLLFWRQLRYYNGINVYRTADLRQMLPKTDSFALGAESALRLLQAGKTYVEVPVRVQGRQGRSNALTWDNFKRVVASILNLRWTIKRN